MEFLLLASSFSVAQIPWRGFIPQTEGPKVPPVPCYSIRVIDAPSLPSVASKNNHAERANSFSLGQQLAMCDETNPTGKQSEHNAIYCRTSPTRANKPGIGKPILNNKQVETSTARTNNKFQARTQFLLASEPRPSSPASGLYFRVHWEHTGDLRSGVGAKQVAP